MTNGNEKRMRVMTEKRREIYNYIWDFIREHRYPPTLGDLGEGFNMTSMGIKYHIDVLEELGFIKNTGKGITMLKFSDCPFCGQKVGD